MKFSELIDPETIIIGLDKEKLQTTDKWSVIDFLIGFLVEKKRIPQNVSGDAKSAIVEREKSLSTGIEKGVALPHGPVVGIENLTGALVIHPGGLNWGSLDGEPSDLIVLIALPKDKAKGSIRTLAGIARLLRNERLRNALRIAKTGAEAYKVIIEEEARDV
ncbi:MAG: PTS sugar transporter subunit IIA [Planctomycetes bacterium]|nr:PTS sugar transporter subunit IIA [Planctomycetota bacterium]